MAKKPKSVENPTIAALAAIAKATDAGQTYFMSSVEGGPLASNNPPLIDVNQTMLDPTDPSKAAVRLTDAGKAMLGNASMPSVANAEAPATQSQYAIIANAKLPESKRRGGGGGAPIKYPFDSLDVGASFFVPKSAEHENPVKTLGSTVSSANMRYAEEDGTKTVTRAKRGPKNKAVRDEAGNKVMETVTVKKWKMTRKFTIRGVESGKPYGEWTAPSDGALIQRVQ